MADIDLHEGWKQPLWAELQADYMRQLQDFLAAEKAAGKNIFPPAARRFRALNLCPPDKTRVILLGQDPYHGPGQADGLCFSVPDDMRPPPSLKNIYKELQADLGIAPAAHGNLEYWAQQGVLMLNSVLSVEEGQAASHQGRGWERFTNAIIAHLAQQERPLIFLLWGGYAQKKAGFIRGQEDGGPHYLLKSAHPSPLAAYRGFFGSRHFSRCNDILRKLGQPPIDWALPGAGPKL